MLYNLFEIKGSKKTLVMTDALSKVKKRQEALRKSHRGDKINYKISPTEETEKFKKKPHDGSYKSGSYATYPKVVKKK